jgi:hypothetical protein
LNVGLQTVFRQIETLIPLSIHNNCKKMMMDDEEEEEDDDD